MPYNALIVPTFGGCRKVELDFNNYEEMGNAIYASLIKIIITPITMRISQELGFTVVGFYNAYCEEECDEENELIEQFSGMRNIKGSVVLCGFDNVYTPLKEYQVERLLDYLRTKY